jgi:hypothetical protein
MFTRSLYLVLCVFMSVGLAWTSSLAAVPSNPTSQAAAKIKANVTKRSRKSSAVSVKLNDGTKLRGKIGDVGDDTFTLIDSKTGQSRTLAYAEVKEVNGGGSPLTTAKISIIAAFGVAAIAILYGVGRAR